MKKPDRFERIVEKGLGYALLNNHRVIGADTAVNHLRREHRAVVRLVKKQERSGMGAYIMLPKKYGSWINVDELLAALARMAK